jgi:hypothetical protein
MPSDLMSYTEWMKRTASVGRSRSDPLKALDSALQLYDKLGGKDARKSVADRFEAWKKSQGTGQEWLRSVRNRDKAVEELAAQLKGGDTDKTAGLVPDFMHPDLVNARLGVVYLFSTMAAEAGYFNVVLEGGLGVANGVLSFGGANISDGGLGDAGMNTAGLALNPTMVPASELLNAGKKTFELPAKLASYQSKFQELRARIFQWLENFVQNLITNLKEKFLSLELPAAMVKAAINCACGALLSASTAGLVSGALDTAKGVVNTLDASFTRYKTWRLGRDVEMASGHPATVVDAIRRAMTLSLFQGLWQLLKGAGGMALTAATASAGLIVSVTIAVSEVLTKIIWRLVEISHMRKFFASAAELWRNRTSANALHKRPIAFSRWYREYAINCPAIAILTLNSGICGDKMTYLSLYSDHSTVITSEQFLAGAAFIDSLKPWGADYLANCGYSFSSSDAFTSSILTFAGKHEEERNKVWQKVKSIANA